MPVDSEEVLSSEHERIELDGLISIDEKHLKQQVGMHTDKEYRCYKDDNGKYVIPKDGIGTLDDKKKKISLKFEQEARCLFMACVVRQPDGSLKGVKLPVFNYTSRLVVGIERFEDEVNLEIQEQLNLL